MIIDFPYGFFHGGFTADRPPYDISYIITIIYIYEI